VEAVPTVAAESSLRAAASPARIVPVTDGPLRELRGSPQLRAGTVLLSLMVLVGAGGWAVTAGGFRRSVPPPSAVLPVKPEPATEPLPTAVPPKPPASVPATDSKVTSALDSVVDAPRPGTDSSSSQPRASSRREPESERKGERTADAEQPPVLRVVPKDSDEQAASTPSETPIRSEVKDALEPLRPAVERCANGQHGVVQLDITVVNTGTVTHAVVAGDFAGTPEGSCMALAARGAKFAPFQKPRFRVIYPFAL
jgi:hypothetical protein